MLYKIKYSILANGFVNNNSIAGKLVIIKPEWIINISWLKGMKLNENLLWTLLKNVCVNTIITISITNTVSAKDNIKWNIIEFFIGIKLSGSIPNK